MNDHMKISCALPSQRYPIARRYSILTFYSIRYYFSHSDEMMQYCFLWTNKSLTQHWASYIIFPCNDNCVSAIILSVTYDCSIGPFICIVAFLVFLSSDPNIYKSLSNCFWALFSIFSLQQGLTTLHIKLNYCPKAFPIPASDPSSISPTAYLPRLNFHYICGFHWKIHLLTSSACSPFINFADLSMLLCTNSLHLPSRARSYTFNADTNESLASLSASRTQSASVTASSTAKFIDWP